MQREKSRKTDGRGKGFEEELVSGLSAFRSHYGVDGDVTRMQHVLLHNYAHINMQQCHLIPKSVHKKASGDYSERAFVSI